MLKTIKNLLFTSVLFISLPFFSSCAKDTTVTTYTGPDLVEFANPNYITPIAPLTRTVATTIAPKTDSMFIQLVGAQRTNNTNVNFEIDPISTAILGTDYSITTPSPIVLLANTSGVKVRVVINKVTVQKKLIIILTGGENVTPSANFKTFTFTLNP